MKKILNPMWWILMPKRLVIYILKTIVALFSNICFFTLLIHFSIIQVFLLIKHIPLLGKMIEKILLPIEHIISPIADNTVLALEKTRSFKIKRTYLIYLAFENLKVRKSRSLVTILGMSFGVGIIVYLLSLGYGIERLVIGQIASLDELRMVDVSSGQSASLRLSDKVKTRISELKGVEKVIPLVSLVGKLDYNRAQTDVLVNAIPNDYLQKSRITIKMGSTFDTKKLSFVHSAPGEVAGLSTKRVTASMGALVRTGISEITVKPDKTVPARSVCSVDSEPIGYIKHIEGGYRGEERWGSEYAPYEPYGRASYNPSTKTYFGKWLWIKAPMFSYDENDQTLPVLDTQGRQVWQYVCVPKKDVVILRHEAFGSVLGESTASAQLVASGSAIAPASPIFDMQIISTGEGGLELVSMNASESATTKQLDSLPFLRKPSGQVIISSGLQKLLGISDADVLQKTLKLSFVVVPSLFPDIQGKVNTEVVDYRIVGVSDTDDIQQLYIPFDDMTALGISNYSQLKVVLKSEEAMTAVRDQIKTLGYNTASAIDTVSEIETFFANLRLILLLLGLIALAVASLGMFNTLTVSLLERTREIGGMKTMGMVAAEIQDLFLAEGMIMGFAGGIGGLLLGYGAGKMTSFGISLIAVTQGLGYLELTYIPLFLWGFILMLSFLVGLFTGLYPAKRTQNISALNALRYE